MAILLILLLVPLFYLIGWGGVGYHQIENGHRISNPSCRNAKW